MTVVNHLDIVLISEEQSPAEEKMEEITSVGKERERDSGHRLIIHGPTLHPAIHVYLFCASVCYCLCMTTSALSKTRK